MRKVVAFVLLPLVTACATTPAAFYKDPTQISDTQLCRTFRKDGTAANIGFWDDLYKEMNRRGLDSTQCDSLVSNQNALIGAGVILGAIVAIAAAKGGGGGGNAFAPSGYDTEWDWDQFYNEYRQLVWACRGVQTAQFADNYRCTGKWQNDVRWPQK